MPSLMNPRTKKILLDMSAGVYYDIAQGVRQNEYKTMKTHENPRYKNQTTWKSDTSLRVYCSQGLKDRIVKETERTGDTQATLIRRAVVNYLRMVER